MAGTLFVLAEESLQASHGEPLTRWYNSVAAEKNFTNIVWDWVPRAGSTDPTRVEKISRNMDRIRSVRPGAIQIFGAVAMPAAGKAAPDGHIENMGAVWGDVPYCYWNTAQTDTQNFSNQQGSGELPIQSNVAGDGRGDRSYYTGIVPNCVIARVDFSELTGLNSQPVSLRCHNGPIVPPIAEVAAMTEYLERNLAYRTGKFPIEPKVIWQQRPDFKGSEAAYKTEINWLPWTKVLSELPDNTQSGRYVFAGNMPDTYWNFLDDNCKPFKGLWFINYRSNAWEMRGRRQGLIRGILYAGLVSVWGEDYWHFAKDSKIVADDIWVSWKSLQRITGVGVLNTVVGDLTLPYLPYPLRVTNLHVE